MLGGKLGPLTPQRRLLFCFWNASINNSSFQGRAFVMGGVLTGFWRDDRDLVRRQLERDGLPAKGPPGGARPWKGYADDRHHPSGHQVKAWY